MDVDDPENGTEVLNSTSSSPFSAAAEGKLSLQEGGCQNDKSEVNPAGGEFTAIDMDDITVSESDSRTYPSPPSNQAPNSGLEAPTDQFESETPGTSTEDGVIPRSKHVEEEQGKGQSPQQIEEESGDTMNFSQESVNVFEEDLHASFDEIQQKRQLVREELDRMRAIEEKEMKKFSKLRRFSPGSRMFPDLRVTGGYHTIAFKVQDFFDPATDPELKPYPSYFNSRWSPDYVPMPCCEENELVVVKVITQTPATSSNGEVLEPKKVKTRERVKNWDNIKKALDKSIESCKDLNQRINYITGCTTKFNVLQYTIEEVMTSAEAYNFFSEVLPLMVQHCLALPKVVTCPIPLLKRYKNYSISLTQKQIASLMANAFFCTFPNRLENEDNFPSINFDELYSCDPTDDRMSAMAQKLRCILHYFERLAMKDEVHNGVLTFTRKSHIAARCPNWSASTNKLKQLVTLYDGTIETQGAGMLQVDFANRFLGGGVLGRGAVQEEILFVIYPELLISRIFTEKLYAGEALLITGCERFSNYAGYSSTFTYTGDFQDPTNHDCRGRLQTQIVAIDALFIRKSVTQFNPRLMERELNKAYAGFSLPYHPQSNPVAIASGKWGCGAFNGDPELKAVLQLMAATEAGRDLVIFAFGDTEFQQTLIKMYSFIENKTVGDVWKLLKQYYSVFCSGNDDQPPNYTLSQFFNEFVSVQDVDMADSAPNSQQEPGSLRPMTTFQTDSDDIEIVPASPETKSETVIDIDDDEMDLALISAFTSNPMPKKYSNERPLADLYSSSEAMRSPSKIGVADLSDERFEDQIPLFQERRIPTSMTSIQSLRVKHLSHFVLSDSDEDGDEKEKPKCIVKDPKTDEGDNKSSRQVTLIVTPQDYQEAFANVSPARTFRIPKHSSSKRKLTLSPSPNEARSSSVRQKQERSPGEENLNWCGN